jgi:pimeloyl-ACP methyl ester carboxylesterase
LLTPSGQRRIWLSRFVGNGENTFCSDAAGFTHEAVMTVSVGRFITQRGARRLRAIFLSFVLIIGLSAGYSEWLGLDAERSHRPTGTFVAVDGHNLHYREHMPPGKSLGTVVLVHGAWTGYTDLFSTLAPHLRGYRVIAVDRPGQGWSERPAGWTFANPARQAKNLMTLLDRLAPERLVFIAHSLGGALAAHIALERPERLHGLVLVDAVTHPFLGRPPILVSLMASDMLGPIINRVIGIPMARMLLDRGVALAFAPQGVPSDYVEASALRLLFREVAFRSNLQDIIAVDAFLGRQAPHYQKLHVPVVAITGDRDALVSPIRNAVTLSREAPWVTLSVLPSMGHMPHHTVPNVIAKAAADLFPRP